MKKLSILMALVLMLVAIVPVAVTPATADEQTTTMDEALITHFDFTKFAIKSNDDANMLRPADASCKGDHEDLWIRDTNTVTFENGIATLKGGASSYMEMTNAGDYASCIDGITTFVAVELTAYPASTNVKDDRVILGIGPDNNPVFQLLVRSQNLLLNYSYGSNGGVVTYKDVPINQWLWIVCSVDQVNETTTMYISLDEGTTWTTVGTSNITTVAKLPKDIQRLVLGQNVNRTSIINYMY